jgi:hypothetical protein
LRPGRPGVIAQENLRRRQENEPAAKIEAGGMVPLCPQSMKGTIFFTGFSPFFIPADIPPASWEKSFKISMNPR